MPSERPAAASAAPRVRSPGTSHAQKMCSPAAAATNTQVSSSIPCGSRYSTTTSPRPNANMTPTARPTFTAFCISTMIGQIPVTPNSTHCAAIHALLVQTIPANSAAGFSV